MLTVHHLGVSQSDRIAWLCEELAIPYHLVCYERDPVTRAAPAAYKALHPSGTAPVITDGALTLGESGAIIDYIIARYGGGRLVLPKDHPDFTDFLYWYHVGNGSMMPMAYVLMSQGAMDAMARDRLDRYLTMLDAHLATGRAWLAGDTFTIADIMMMFPLTTVRLFLPYDLSPYPQLQAYIRRVADRPAFQAAKMKADPDLVVPLD